MLRLARFLFAVSLAAAYSTGAGQCVDTYPAAMGTTCPPKNFSVSTTAWTLTGPSAAVNGGSSVTLTLGGGTNYMGILLYCLAGTSYIGKWNSPGSDFGPNQYCTPTTVGLTHTNKNTKTTLSFTWVAPNGAQTGVVCHAIVLDTNTQWHLQLTTASFNVNAGTSPTNAPAGSPSAAPALGVSALLLAIPFLNL